MTDAIDAPYWSRMAGAAHRGGAEQREEQEAEAVLWERAVNADLAPER